MVNFSPTCDLCEADGNVQDEMHVFFHCTSDGFSPQEVHILIFTDTRKTTNSFSLSILFGNLGHEVSRAYGLFYFMNRRAVIPLD